MRSDLLNNYRVRKRAALFGLNLAVLKYIVQTSFFLKNSEKRLKLMCQVHSKLSASTFKNINLRLNICIRSGRTRSVYSNFVSRHQFKIIQPQGFTVGWRKD